MSYQHGLRPIQMSRMRFKDVRLYTDPGQQPIFHFVARRAKKRNPNDTKFFTRKVKHDWAWPFAEYYRRRSAELGAETDTPAFPLQLRDITTTIGDTTESINKTIDKTRLLGLPPDNQIGAVPHGIPISGIGGCGLGQSLCELNPVLSCYTCRKFIPLDDTDLHRQVLQDLRGVVRFFYDESRGDRQSPAFAQIRTTLAAIQRVITDIEGSDASAKDEAQ